MSLQPGAARFGDLWSRSAYMVAALWWGALTGLAFVAVPALFALLGSPAVAGPVAAWLFSFLCKLTWFCGGWLIVFFYWNRPSALVGWTRSAMYFVVAAVLAAAVQDGWVAQLIVNARATGGNLKLWHALGSGLVMLQWVAATVVMWRFTRAMAKA